MKNHQVTAENIFKVQRDGKKYVLITTTDKNVGEMGVNYITRKKAYDTNSALRRVTGKGGKISFRLISMSEYSRFTAPMNNGEVSAEPTPAHNEITNFIHSQSVSLRPESLVMSDLKWKYLIRSAVRAKNIMMTGPAGCGKTMAAKALVKALNRPDFYFNLGSTQDARATLIGNTHFSKNSGTFFSKSAFVTAITTPNAVILLDELSRAHPDAWNILMTVLDQSQRYLRLDEAEGSPIVKVAEGVTFVATANIGNEYTSTRVIDRAILDRFVTIEMDVLNDEQEFGLLKYMYPDANVDSLLAIAEIAHHTREVSRDDVGKLSTMISTRLSIEAAGLVYDGFSLLEACEIAFFPFFPADGGIDSERTYMKQLVQKWVKDESTDDELFSEADTVKSDETVW